MHTWGDGADDRPSSASTSRAAPRSSWSPRPSVGSRPINRARSTRRVDIIRQRVDGSGVAEAEVATQGGRNIVVSLPGKPAQSTVDALSKSSQLRFRPVLVQAPNPRPPRHRAPPRPRRRRRRPPRPRAPATPAREGDRQASGTASTSAGSAFPQALRAPSATTPTPTATPQSAASTPVARRPPRAPRRRAPRFRPQPDGSEPDRRERCHRDRERPGPDHPGDRRSSSPRSTAATPSRSRPSSTTPTSRWSPASVDGTAKYILGPVEVDGDKTSRTPRSGCRAQPAGPAHRRARDPAVLQRQGRQEVRRRHVRALVALPAAAEPVRDRPRQPGHLAPRRPTRRSPTARRQHHRQLHRRQRARAWPTSSSSAPCRCPSSLQTQDDISPTARQRAAAAAACSPA